MWTRAEVVAAVAASLGITLAAAGMPSSVSPDAPASEHPSAVSYAEDIDPVLQESCVRCHGGEDEGEQRIEAGLNLTTYEHLMAGSEFGSVVEPGDPDNSMLVVLIEDGDMPEEADPLPAETIAKIKTWIEEGAENN